MASALRELVRTYKRNRLESRLRTARGEEIKFANAQLNWREFWHGRTQLRSRPRQVHVGTNWTCNLRCNFCLLTQESTQKRLKALPPRQLEIGEPVFEAIKELMPYPELITLTPLGEPMLYSRFGQLLEHHRRIGSRNLSMTTNANLINDERARMLVEGGMNHMFVSVDSSDPDVYAGMRVRGDLAKVEEGLEAINRWKERLGSETPVLSLCPTFMERNVRQMPDLLAFAERHGFTTYGIQLMEMEDPRLEEEFLGHHIPLAKEMLLETLRRARNSRVRVEVNIAMRNLLSAHLSQDDWRAISAVTVAGAGKPDAAPPSNGNGSAKEGGRDLSTQGMTLVEKCHFPWYYLLVDTDGDCRPCCWAGASYGNLNRQEFGEIWNSPKAVSMRQDFLMNHIPKACQGRHCRVDLNHHGTLEK